MPMRSTASEAMMPGPPGVGDDGHRVVFGYGLAGKGLGVVEQVLHRAGAHNAHLLEGRVVGLLRAGQRAGVRGGRPRAGAGGARLDGHHRLLPGDLARHLHELGPVGNAFQVAHDHVGLGVFGPGAQEVDLVQVGLVADAVEAREADALAQRHVQDGGAQRARLRHEGDAALARHAGGEGGVEAGHGVDDAQHVGAHDAHVVAPGIFQQLLFQRPAFAAHFAEARRDDHRAGDALLAALFDDAGHGLGRHQHHGQVHRAGDVAHRWDRRAGPGFLWPWD